MEPAGGLRDCVDGVRWNGMLVRTGCLLTHAVAEMICKEVVLGLHVKNVEID